jgi:hypothetical protein
MSISGRFRRSGPERGHYTDHTLGARKASVGILRFSCNEAKFSVGHQAAEIFRKRLGAREFHVTPMLTRSRSCSKGSNGRTPDQVTIWPLSTFQWVPTQSRRETNASLLTPALITPECAVASWLDRRMVAHTTSSQVGANRCNLPQGHEG